MVPVETMVEQFRLEDVSRSPAFFDEQKLQHFNAHYIRELGEDEFTALAAEWVEPHVERFDAGVFAQVAPLAQTRVRLLSELAPTVAFLFTDDVDIEEASWEKAVAKNEWSADVLREAAAAFADCAWDAETLKDTTLAIGERHGVKLGKAQAPIRVAVTGRTVGLPLFESLEALGRERTLPRLERALARAGA
jgi:glutamyl-tRNA synthetase